ncbi:MAG: aldo/keto reductase, partial [Coleofasciculaceae cyanobacterium]
MQYRRFGRTNLSLSVASLGTMRFTSHAIAQQVVSDAIAAGINHIETARGYGNSEAYLGSALAELSRPRHTLYITSKVLPSDDASEVERSIDMSLAQLKTDYLDNLALHGINTEDHLKQLESPTGGMAAIQAAMADGRVRHVGFSTHGALDLILRVISTNRFAFVNLHYYLFFQRNAPAIALAHENDMGVFIISPGDKGGQLYTPPQTLIDACYPYSALELNHRFLLSDPRITTLSIGPATPEELRPPLKRLGCEPLSADEA